MYTVYRNIVPSRIANSPHPLPETLKLWMSEARYEFKKKAKKSGFEEKCYMVVAWKLSH